MGKKRGGHGHAPAAPPRAGNQAVSLREESSGKTRADAASLLRVQHLQRLAAWAGGEAGAGPLGALLGRRLAANAEAAGIPLAASTFLCQRSGSLLTSYYTSVGCSRPSEFACLLWGKVLNSSTERSSFVVHRLSNCCMILKEPICPPTIADIISIIIPLIPLRNCGSFMLSSILASLRTCPARYYILYS